MIYTKRCSASVPYFQLVFVSSAAGFACNALLNGTGLSRNVIDGMLDIASRLIRTLVRGKKELLQKKIANYVRRDEIGFERQSTWSWNANERRMSVYFRLRYVKNEVLIYRTVSSWSCGIRQIYVTIKSRPPDNMVMR